MNPADRDELKRMLQSALQPMQEQIDALRLPLEKEIEDLKERDRTFSGQHKLVTNELLPKMASAQQKTRMEDLTAIAAAMATLVDVTNETAERQARTESDVRTVLKHQQAGLVQITDAAGTSIRPASMVAAESGVRNETKTGLMQIDVTASKKKTEDVDTWQKRVTTPLLVLMPIIVELFRQLFLKH